MNIFLLRIVAILLIIASSASAQSVPALVNYQGRLANPDGSPLPTADYELSFRVWDTATNGSLVWGPQFFDGTTGPGRGSRIPAVQGWFNLMLGPVDTNGRSLVNAFGSSNRFVEVTVSNRPPILPRQQILATPYAIQAANGAPPGTIVAFGGVSVPEGWILCDGRPLRSNDYPRLFLAIGTVWGDASDDADSMTNFRAPDFRGLFLRGVDDSPLMGTANRDPDRGDATRGQIATGSAFGNRVGSQQAGAIENHGHTLSPNWVHGFGPSPGGGVIGHVFDLGQGSPIATTSVGGSETRPKNAYVNYIIKF